MPLIWLALRIIKGFLFDVLWRFIKNLIISFLAILGKRSFPFIFLIAILLMIARTIGGFQMPKNNSAFDGIKSFAVGVARGSLTIATANVISKQANQLVEKAKKLFSKNTEQTEPEDVSQEEDITGE